MYELEFWFAFIEGCFDKYEKEYKIEFVNDTTFSVTMHDKTVTFGDGDIKLPSVIRNKIATDKYNRYYGISFNSDAIIGLAANGIEIVNTTATFGNASTANNLKLVRVYQKYYKRYAELNSSPDVIWSKKWISEKVGEEVIYTPVGIFLDKHKKHYNFKSNACPASYYHHIPIGCTKERGFYVKHVIDEQFCKLRDILYLTGNIYSSYFKCYKPNEFITIDKTKVEEFPTSVAIKCATMNRISNICSKVDAWYNDIIKAIGFKLRNKDFIISKEEWSRFKEFMKVEEVAVTAGTSTHQGCYLIQLNCDEGTTKYKIGKAKNLLTRLKAPEYRNAFIYCTMYVNDETTCEKEIIKEFSDRFTQVTSDDTGNYGRETFSGDIKDMMKLFMDICMRYI